MDEKNKKKLFNKYYFKLVWEGLVKSLIWGFILGFTFSLIPGIIAIIYNFSAVWYSLAVAFGVAIITTPIFYFLRFAPKKKQVAWRVDRLGLEERLITMVELEKDDSLIAKYQRDDANKKLASNHRPLKISLTFFIAPIVAVLLLATGSIVMTTVSVFNVSPKIAYIDPAPIPERQFGQIEVSYRVDDSEGYTGGYISGYADQILTVEYIEVNETKITIGQNASTVIAVADYGFIFKEWSDKLKTPERTDKNVRDNFTVYALFIPTIEAPDYIDDEKRPPPSQPPPQPPPDRYNFINQMFNSKTYYGDHFYEFYESIMKMLSEQDVTTEMIKMYESYYEALLKEFAPPEEEE